MLFIALFRQNAVQQTHYNKLILVMLGLVVFCSVVASLVVVFFLAPVVIYGGGPFFFGNAKHAFENTYGWPTPLFSFSTSRVRISWRDHMTAVYLRQEPAPF